MQDNNQAKPKVLVADDERVIADTLAIILNQSGFEATAVYSGEKAVEIAGTLKPDMLISDVIMTDLNGIDAAIKIRDLLPACKILVLLQARPPPPICSIAPATRATNSKSSLNPSIRKIFSLNFAAEEQGTEHWSQGSGLRKADCHCSCPLKIDLSLQVFYCDLSPVICDLFFRALNHSPPFQRP